MGTGHGDFRWPLLCSQEFDLSENHSGFRVECMHHASWVVERCSTEAALNYIPRTLRNQFPRLDE